MASLLGDIFGGNPQTAPVMPTYNPLQASNLYNQQNFGKAQNESNQITTATSANNLATNITGLNTLDSGAITGINEEQNLGNTLLSGSTAALPSWARAYLNDGQRVASESAVGRGVGAFSDNGLSGANEFLGKNVMQLLGFGSQLASGASQEAQGIVGSNMYRSDPMAGLITAGQFQQAGEFNTQIEGENAVNATAASNYNATHSPVGSAIRVGLDTIATLAGDFLGGGGKAMAM